jgi:hypothetical protein
MNISWRSITQELRHNGWLLAWCIALIGGQLTGVDVVFGRVTLLDVVCILYCITHFRWLVRFCTRCREWIASQPQVIRVVIFGLCLQAGALWLIARDVHAVLYAMRWIVNAITALGVVVQSAPHQRTRLLIALCCVGWAWWVFGVTQLLLLPDARLLVLLGWDDHLFRMIGTMLDPNYLALLFVLWWWVSEALRAQFNHKYFMTMFLQVAQACAVLGVMLTLSRSGFLAWVVSMGIGAVMVRAQRKRFISLLMVVCLIAAWCSVYLPSNQGEGLRIFRTASVQQRVRSALHVFNTLRGSDWVVGEAVGKGKKADPFLVPGHAREVQGNY